jgi:hypothetical protein
MTANLKSLGSAGEKEGERLPPRGQPVVVTCLCFKCIGYLDEKGRWRGRYDGRELPEVLEWAPL